MKIETKQVTIISDRSLSAFLLARGHEVTYFPRPSGHLDFMFDHTPELSADLEEYYHNATIPVRSFLFVQQQLRDAIKDHRHRHSARR